MSFPTNLLSVALPMVIAPRQFHNLLHAAVHNPLLPHGDVILFSRGLQVSYVRCNLFGTRAPLIHPGGKRPPEDMEASFQSLQARIAEYGSHPMLQIGSRVPLPCPCPDD